MLDRQTEIISHFIGQFDQASESYILRMHYDDFRAARAVADEANALLHVEVSISAEIGLTDFAPGLRFALPEMGPPQAGPLAVGHASGMAVMPPRGSGLDLSLHLDLGPNGLRFGWPSAPILDMPLFDVPPPGGLISVAIQKNWLFDDDILMTRPFDLPEDMLANRTKAAIDGRVEALVGRAEQLDPFGLALTDTGALATPQSVEATLDAVAAITMPAGAQGAVHWSSSHAAPDADPVPGDGGVLIDGLWSDALPDTLVVRLEDRAEEYAAAGDSEAGTGTPSPEPVHQLQTGDNLLINEATFSINWVDAPTIAVAGAQYQLTLISQINVWSDHDITLGSSVGAAQGSAATNLAGISQQSHAARPFGDPTHEGGPLTYAIADIAGDLVLRSYTVQINLVSDDDVVSFETSFHEIDIGLGANMAANLLLLQGFDVGFEAILVGGDMINLVSLMQLNILNDDDLVATAPGTAGNISTSGNLLWNEAHVGWQGIDSAAEMTEGVMAALASLTGGGTFDPFSLDGETFLAGSEVGILLTIGGDFINEHHLVQINLLSDADTVQLHAAALAEAGWSPIDLETGGNVLANLAEVSVNGVDSVVMAGGGVYSDLVIYQAGMYDDGSLDLSADGEEAGNGLASEAVAFLVDGMIEPGGGPDDQGGGADWGPQGCGSGTHDTLSAMVA